MINDFDLGIEAEDGEYVNTDPDTWETDDSGEVDIEAAGGAPGDVTEDDVSILAPLLPRAVDEAELERRCNNDYR